MPITASQIYAFVTCPHRVWRDLYDDPAQKDPVNEFVELLWDKGTQHERNLIASSTGSLQITDLSAIPKANRAVETLAAMRANSPFIYHGRLEVDDLIGEPDLLERQVDGQYLPIDIKSGIGLEAADDEFPGRFKKTYILQLCLYVDALRRLGFANHFLGKIWDSEGVLVDYRLDDRQSERNRQTWWALYAEVLAQVRAIVAGRLRTESALISACKLCPWYTSCKRQCQERRDLSLVHELGRSRKEALLPLAVNVDLLAEIDPEAVSDARGRTGIPGVGLQSLEKFVRRAKVLCAGGTAPVVLQPFKLPERPIELFFDIEADPTQDIVYLHGVVERRNGNEKFHAFVADDITPAAEERAWRDFWQYVGSLPREKIAVYYYSKYERTAYRALRLKYPSVISEPELEAFFEPSFAVDLYYDIVLPCTDWPTSNYSIKTLAQLLGFRWRDPNPSGAASIQWYNEWCKDREPNKLQRILDYNEDDCLATRVLKDCLAAVSPG